MGYLAGRVMATNGGRAWIGVMLLLALSSCVVQPVSRRSSREAWQRADPGTPQLLVRAYYGTPDEVQAILADLGDVVRPVRRWARLGNGVVSVRFVDERGRGLRTVEGGGRLIVEGRPGQVYAIQVRNETDVIVEILPMVDGLDLEKGLGAGLEMAGRRVGPRQETVFGTRASADGKGESLRFGEGAGPVAVHRESLTGTDGSVVIAVFLGKGVDSFADRPARERLRANAFGEPGAFPQRRYEPMRLPYQYR